MDPDARAEVSQEGWRDVKGKGNLEKEIGRRLFLHLSVSGVVFCMDEGFSPRRRQDDSSFVLSCPFLLLSREGNKVANRVKMICQQKTSNSTPNLDPILVRSELFPRTLTRRQCQSNVFSPHFSSIHLINANSIAARITKHTLPSSNRFWDFVRRVLSIDPERSSGVFPTSASAV